MRDSAGTNARLAFLFLTVDNLNQQELWDEFFLNADPRLYSIYVHPKYPDKVTQNLLLSRMISDPLETQWAHITIVRALNRLLEQAVGDKQNQKFVYCSESCIPLFNFSFIYSQIMNDDRGFLHYYNANKRRHIFLKDRTFVSKDLFLKTPGQGWVLTPHLVEYILGNDHTHLFQDMKCADEHYYVNLFLHLGIDLEKYLHNRRLTFSNWKEGTPGGGHPKTYDVVTEQDIEEARANGYLFFRKASNTAKIPVNYILHTADF